MRLLFTYPHLTAPTVETVREYATKRFEKLNKFLPKFSGEHAVRITVYKERKTFVVHVEVAVPKALNIKVSDFDLRKAIDMAYKLIKEALVKYRDKMHEFRNPVT